MEKGRIEFAIGFLSTLVAGLIFITADLSHWFIFDFWFQRLTTALFFIGCGGYTITGIVCWFTGIDDFLFRE